MAGSFSNGWSLVKGSADVLRMDKELLVFPLLSGVATVLVMVSFFVPMVALGGIPALAQEDVGPIEAVKESAALFRRTRGEQVVGSFGMGWAVFSAALSWLLASALKGIYTAALYRYASTGEAGFFDPAMVGNAFRPKH